MSCIAEMFTKAVHMDRRVASMVTASVRVIASVTIVNEQETYGLHIKEYVPLLRQSTPENPDPHTHVA